MSHLVCFDRSPIRILIKFGDNITFLNHQNKEYVFSVLLLEPTTQLTCMRVVLIRDKKKDFKYLSTRLTSHVADCISKVGLQL